MGLEERVLLGRPWLDVSPPAAHPVLTGVDQVPSLGNPLPVHQVRGHELNLLGRGQWRRACVDQSRSWALWAAFPSFFRVFWRWLRSVSVPWARVVWGDSWGG